MGRRELLVPGLLIVLLVFAVLASLVGGHSLQLIGFIVLVVLMVVAGARYLRPAGDKPSSPHG